MGTLAFAISQGHKSQLWDHGWLDVTRFEVRGSDPDYDALTVAAAWFRDPLSRRCFCSPRAWGGDIDRHGPWLIDGFDAGWLVPVAMGELRRRVATALQLEGWEGEPVLPTAEQMRAVDAWLAAVEERGDEVLALEGPAEAAWEKWAGLWDVFAEFLCVARDQRTLTVAVIGQD